MAIITINSYITTLIHLNDKCSGLNFAYLLAILEDKVLFYRTLKSFINPTSSCFASMEPWDSSHQVWLCRTIGQMISKLLLAQATGIIIKLLYITNILCEVIPTTRMNHSQVHFWTLLCDRFTHQSFLLAYGVHGGRDAVCYDLGGVCPPVSLELMLDSQGGNVGRW